MEETRLATRQAGEEAKGRPSHGDIEAFWLQKVALQAIPSQISTDERGKYALGAMVKKCSCPAGANDEGGHHCRL